MLAAIALSTAGAAQTLDCAVELRDVATEIGIEFVHDRGTTADKHLPETMGAGVSWLDYDGDGWLDLYAVQSGPFPPGPERRSADRLFRNRGDGTFEDVSERAGTGRRGAGQGSVAGDLDGDGDVDLYLTNYGPDRVLLNDGQGRFDDRTESAGISVDGWSSSAALADADGDGDLDLYVSRYVEYEPDHGIFCAEPESGDRKYCDPSLFLGASDRFFRNAGDGRFIEATATAGIAPAAGRGLGVVFADLDSDRDADIYVANDLNQNFLFANRGDGTFEDVTLLSGAALNRQGRPEAGMGVAVGDVDGDLDPDLAVTNFDIETNTLYLNAGGLIFDDVAARSGFGVPSFNRLAFGIAAADLDFDGDLDYYLANGHIFDQPSRENVRFAQADQVLLGDGKGGFALLECAGLASRETVARGLGQADFDRDGDADLAVQENGGPLELLRNDGRPHSWLGVSLRGQGANSGAIGAEVTLSSNLGAQRRWVVAGDSYQSSSDSGLLFHPRPKARLESLLIRWPARGSLRLERPPQKTYLVVPQAPLVGPSSGRTGSAVGLQ
jgi:hypothetical protein